MAKLALSGLGLTSLTQKSARIVPLASARTYSSGFNPPPEKTKYFSIHDIPDEMIPIDSKRDPDNPVYRTRRFVNLRKRQILYQQRDGIPNWYRTVGDKVTYHGMQFALLAMTVYNIYLLNTLGRSKK